MISEITSSGDATPALTVVATAAVVIAATANTASGKRRRLLGPVLLLGEVIVSPHLSSQITPVA
jgi:hypothetical protein